MSYIPTQPTIELEVIQCARAGWTLERIQIRTKLTIEEIMAIWIARREKGTV